MSVSTTAAHNGSALRVVEAAEELRAAARAYGLDPDAIADLYAPLALRIDAWLERTRRLLGGGHDE